VTPGGSLKIHIDRNACTGHGRCYALAPQLIEPDDMGYGVVAMEDVPVELEGAAQQCVANCPEKAVSLSEWMRTSLID
jgi:ferredoxin